MQSVSLKDSLNKSLVPCFCNADDLNSANICVMVCSASLVFKTCCVKSPPGKLVICSEFSGPVSVLPRNPLPPP